MKNIALTESSIASLESLSQLLPEVEEDFLIETALALTAILYQKASEGSLIQIKSEEGKVEELRFKVKKPVKKKAKVNS
jgi:hypothetical protein